MATAAISALAVSNFFGNMNIGVAMAIGALLSSPGDIAGSFRRRTLGIFIAVCLVVFATTITGYAKQSALILLPVLVILVFTFSLISVYGFRASLVAFSGLFAVVLSLAKIPSADSVVVHALYVGLGGCWYLVLSTLLHFLNPQKQAEILLSEGFRLTSEYLRVRAELISTSAEEREELKKRLSQLQSDINDKHETIRELVISRRAKSGRSGDARRKMLIFIELVDILELSMANPVNYERMEELLRNDVDKLKILKEWSLLMADELIGIATVFEEGEKFYPNPALETLRLRANVALHTCADEEHKIAPSGEAVFILRNLIDFKEKQQEKIISIARLLRDLKVEEDFAIKDIDAAKFITGQEYSLRTLQDNLDLHSPIFRHSLRLTVVLLSGYIIGSFFELQNTYWILLTSLVIMRPGYALTKQRSKQRLYGTLIGGAIAVSVVFLTQNLVVYAVLSVITLILALSMIQRNYKASAIFITLNIVFVYSLMTPDPFRVIQFRLTDTLIGAGLAFLGNALLWPTWEYKGIKNFIAESIKANAAYLKEMSYLYEEKDGTPTSYKLMRKNAFLAIGNLNAAFQRMTQEPESRQREVGSIYEIITLNQEFLSSTASLGAFIRTHPTTKVSTHFKTYISAIQDNLSSALAGLAEQEVTGATTGGQLEEASRYFDEKYKSISRMNSGETEIGPPKDKDMRNRFQELQLVRDQLRWLFQLSENMKVQVLSNLPDTN